MLNDLLQALLFLLPIGAGVAVLAILGRDDQADEHDLSDYHEPAPTVEPGPRRLTPAAAVEPAPADVGAPLFDQLAARTYVPLDDEAVRGLAAEWLREIGEQARAELELAR